MEEKNIFRYKFGKYIYIILIAMCVCVLPFAIFSILRLAGAGKLESFYPALDIVSVVFSLLILTFYAVSIFVSWYKIDEKYVRLVGTVIHFKIPTNRMLKLVLAKNMLIAYYSMDAETVEFFVVNIKSSEIDSFVKAVKKYNPIVIYEEKSENESTVTDSDEQ